MADTTTTPNMGLPVPVPSEAPGPDWANDVVTDMYAIDSHDHTSGKGVPITTSAISINSDLPFGNYNATGLKSARFTAQGSPLAGGTDLGCVYVSGVDLYYNDENGNQIRMTASGAPAGATGTITGLPSGTASAAFSAGTFTFQSATNTGATVSAGPFAIGSTTASGKHTTIASAGAQAADISLTLPTVAPTANYIMTSDGSGNMAWDPITGTGNVVRNTSPTIATPTFSGAPAGTIIGSTYAPTVTASNGSGAASGSFFYQRIGNVVMVSGTMTYDTALSAGTWIFQATVTVPILPTNNFASFSDIAGTMSRTAQGTTSNLNILDRITATTSAKTITVQLNYSSHFTDAVSVNFMYSCA